MSTLYDNYPCGVDGSHPYFNDEQPLRIPPWATCGNCGLRPACPEIQTYYWCDEGDCYVRSDWKACDEWLNGDEVGRS